MEQQSWDRAVSHDQGSANQRLWLAVIESAIAEWVRGPMPHKHRAEFFLFQDEDDFPFVCRSAGLDPGCVRETLWEVRAQTVSGSSTNVA